MLKPLKPGQIIQPKRPVRIFDPLVNGQQPNNWRSYKVQTNEVMMVLYCKINGRKYSINEGFIRETDWEFGVLFGDKRCVFTATWSEISSFIETCPSKIKKTKKKSNGNENEESQETISSKEVFLREASLLD